MSNIKCRGKIISLYQDATSPYYVACKSNGVTLIVNFSTKVKDCTYFHEQDKFVRICEICGNYLNTTNLPMKLP